MPTIRLGRRRTRIKRGRPDPAVPLSRVHLVVSAVPLETVLGTLNGHIGPETGELTTAWWLHWQVRPLVLVPLILFALIYARGWRRLRRRGLGRWANPWRLGAYIGGLTLVAIALLSGIDALAERYFFVHMIQHELLMMLAPPLLLLAAPLPMLSWGLPSRPRRQLAGLLSRKAAFRRGLAIATRPQFALAYYIGALWFWHAPAAYQAALVDERLHDLEHLSFFLSAMAFWWLVIGAAPRLHASASFGLRMVILLVAFAQNEILAVILSFATRPLYPIYAERSRGASLSALEDQMIGGSIMWIPGGMMYVIAAVLMIAFHLDREPRRGTDEGGTDAGATVDAQKASRV